MSYWRSNTDKFAQYRGYGQSSTVGKEALSYRQTAKIANDRIEFKDYGWSGTFVGEEH